LGGRGKEDGERERRRGLFLYDLPLNLSLDDGALEVTEPGGVVPAFEGGEFMAEGIEEEQAGEPGSVDGDQTEADLVRGALGGEA
jgi:hypothetical protein